MEKILIVEDDITVQEELFSLLKNAGYNAVIIKEFFNCEEKILSENADLLLLDINIPYFNGELLLKNLRKVTDIPVIMLTSSALESDEVLSMSYGADDYITKPYNPTILLLRIGAILKRHIKDDFTMYQDVKVNLDNGTLKYKNIEIVLTKNEMIIFKHLLSNRGKIVSRDELMTNLWNNYEYINDNALTVNISRLRSKLESLGLKETIETKKKVGYKLL